MKVLHPCFTGLTFGQALRRLRQRRGWTLERTAKAARISRVTLNRWETSVNQPRLEELDTVLTTLEVSPQQKRELIAAMTSPRAAALIRQEFAEIAERSDIGPLPGGGDLLREMRLRQGFSLEALATRLGVTARTLRFWEKGEIWPTGEQLRRFGEAVKASEEEIAALCSGRFLQNPGATAPALSWDALEQQWRTLERQILSAPRELIDLRLLSLERAVWTHAVQTAHGRRLLSRIYITHSRYLDFRGYDVQAGVYAERALDLIPGKGIPEPFYLDAAIFAANALTYSGKRHGPKRALTQLRHWLPLAREPHREAWTLSAIAQALAKNGAMDEALAVAAEACVVVERSPMPGDRERRQSDYAQLLIQAGQAEAALLILSKIETDTIYFDIHWALAQAEAHFALEEKSLAQDWLQHALRDIDAIRSESLRQRAEAFSRQF